MVKASSTSARSPPHARGLMGGPWRSVVAVAVDRAKTEAQAEAVRRCQNIARDYDDRAPSSPRDAGAAGPEDALSRAAQRRTRLQVSQSWDAIREQAVLSAAGAVERATARDDYRRRARGSCARASARSAAAVATKTRSADRAYAIEIVLQRLRMRRHHHHVLEPAQIIWLPGAPRARRERPTASDAPGRTPQTAHATRGGSKPPSVG